MMFHEWGFLLAEIWGLLLLSALIGLFAGWLIWHRRPDTRIDRANIDDSAPPQ